jgi:HAD superfamily hydrolase (TIGR01509 family)
VIKFILLDFYNVLYFPREERVNEEVVEFLQSHNAQYGFGLLSAVNIDLDSWLESHQLKKYFQFIKTTMQVEMSKTDPGIYEMVGNSFDLKPEQVLFVDDLAENITAAKKAGLQTILYKPSQSFSIQISDYI